MSLESDSCKRTLPDTEQPVPSPDPQKPPPAWPVLPDIKGLTNYRFDFPEQVRAKPDSSYVAPPPEYVFPFTVWVTKHDPKKSKSSFPCAEVWFGTDDPRNKLVPFNLKNPSYNRICTFAIYHLLSKLPHALQIENGKPIRVCVPSEPMLNHVKRIGKQNDIRFKLVKEAQRLWTFHGIEIQFVVTDKRYDGRGIKFQEFIDGTFSLDDKKKGQEDYRADGVTVTRTVTRRRVSTLAQLKDQ